MNQSKTRGAVQLVALVVAGVVVVASWLAYKVFEPGRNKGTADKAAIAAAKTEQQAVDAQHEAVAVKAAVAEAVSAHAQVIAKHEEVEGNVAGFVYAANTELLKEPNPSPPVKLATTLTDSAYQALGASLPPAQKTVWDSLLAARQDDKVAIAKRDATIAQMTTDAVATHATLAAVTEHAAAADATALAQAGTMATQSTLLVTTAHSSSKLTAQNKAWADGEEGWWAKAKAAIALIVLLVGTLLALSIRHYGLTQTAKNLVAYNESLKTMATGAGVAASAIEDHAKAWWEGDLKQLAVVAKIKQALRL